MLKTELEKKVIKLEKLLESKRAIIQKIVKENETLKDDYNHCDNYRRELVEEKHKAWKLYSELKHDLAILENTDSTLKAMVKLVNKS